VNPGSLCRLGQLAINQVSSPQPSPWCTDSGPQVLNRRRIHRLRPWPLDSRLAALTPHQAHMLSRCPSGMPQADSEPRRRTRVALHLHSAGLSQLRTALQTCHSRPQHLFALVAVRRIYGVSATVQYSRAAVETFLLDTTAIVPRARRRHLFDYARTRQPDGRCCNI
jgi:hypothetical protein